MINFVIIDLMIKSAAKILKIVIISGFIIFVFGNQYSFAIDQPVGTTPCTPFGDPATQTLSLYLSWDPVAGVNTTLPYRILYKDVTDTSWTTKDLTEDSENKYFVSGLSPGTSYEWYVISCGDAACNDNNTSTVCAFLTMTKDSDDEEELPTPIDLINPLLSDTLQDALELLLDIIYAFIFVLAPILLAYAAFVILTSQGNPEQINKGRTIILWAVIALVIALLARGAPAIVKSMFGAKID